MRISNLKFTLPFLALALMFAATRVVFAQTAKSPLPPPTGYVNDFANVIDPATKAQMETILQNLKQRADIEFAVVTVKTTGDTPIFDYTLAVARGWGIGSREGEKNGLILLVAVDDHKSQMQVSRHLEGDLPDGLIGATLRKMRPYFQQNNYSQGLMMGVQTVVATLAQKRGFSIEGIDQKYAYKDNQPQNAPSRSSANGTAKSFGVGVCNIIIFIVLILIILRIISQGGGSGCLNLLLLNALLNSGGRGGSGGDGGSWGGGSDGGSWGGGSSDGGFGGFGGGGDFGGGGAGDSW